MMKDEIGTTCFLNPQGRLLNEVVDWLVGQEARFDAGARSLAHLMVVVPTAQSGRNLRLALARRFPEVGVIPPRVVLPMELVVPECQERPDGSEVELAAVFQQFMKIRKTDVLKLGTIIRPEEFDDLTARFALFDQLQDIWRILAGNGYLMRDVARASADEGSEVAKVLSNELGDERGRWTELAQLEKWYFDSLHAANLNYPTENIAAARKSAKIIGPEIEEIVLPALADPLKVVEDVLVQQQSAGKRITVLFHCEPGDRAKFNAFGRPITSEWTGAKRPTLPALTNADIIRTANTSALAAKVASDWPDVESQSALPGLALCDADLYSSVSAAFLSRKYVIHNPERHALAQSSLGRNMKRLIALYESKEMMWKDFIPLLRSSDVLAALHIHGEQRVRLLKGIDICQNNYLPTTIPTGLVFPENSDVKPFLRKDLDFFFKHAREFESVLEERRQGKSLTEFLRAMLQWMFSDRWLGTKRDETEFMAAASAAGEMLRSLESGCVKGLSMTASETAALVKRALGACVYSLEPDSSDAIKTEGWLELAWSASECLSLAGFHEGKVPDSVVGHPFVPDTLRTALGLVSNQDRLARDTWLLKELITSHAPHDIRLYIARVTDAGDICRPSRLLFLCSDPELPLRVGHLFGEIPERQTDRRRVVEWTMNLPDEIPLPGHFSPSAIDTYVKCPFTYLLERGLGMQPYKEKSELEANDFGTLAHAALKMYADIQIARGDDQLTNENDIRKVFEIAIFPAIRARYKNPTLNIDIQLRALEGRLGIFAKIQADWAQKGWRICAAEKSVNGAKPFAMEGIDTVFHGSVDRVDCNRETGKYCVIDYKTWDKKSLNGRVFSSKAAKGARLEEILDFAHRLGFPTLLDSKGNEKQRILSVQLPVYGRCLEAMSFENFVASDAEYTYLILGKIAKESVLETLKPNVVTASIETAKRALELIKQNVFWPVGPGENWKRNFGPLFVTNPQKDLEGTEWVNRQLAKTEVRNA